MENSSDESATHWLRRWSEGDPAAVDRMMPLVYDELRRIAGNVMRSERKDHTLQPTALLHEAYARIVGSEANVTDRVHFMRLAARVMRRVLVDHARMRGSERRGGPDVVRITLSGLNEESGDQPDRLVEMDDLIEQLGKLDPRKQQVLELTVFGGLSQQEIADTLSISIPSIQRDLRTARAWIRAELEQSGPRNP